MDARGASRLQNDTTQWLARRSRDSNYTDKTPKYIYIEKLQLGLSNWPRLKEFDRPLKTTKTLQKHSVFATFTLTRPLKYTGNPTTMSHMADQTSLDTILPSPGLKMTLKWTPEELPDLKMTPPNGWPDALGTAITLTRPPNTLTIR